MNPRMFAAAGPLSRRIFLQRMGLVAVSAGITPSLLSSCGSDSSGGGGGDTVGGTVNFLSWEGYDLPDPLKAWRDANGVEVNASYIGNHDDIQAKIKAGGNQANYDLITYYQGYRELYTELDILTELDETKIPNLKNLFPYFASDVGGFWSKDGRRTGVPFTFGAQGLTYDTDQVDGMHSWYDLLDPKLKGKVGVMDDTQGTLAVGCRILGLDPAALAKADLPEVTDLIAQFLDQARGIAPSYGDIAEQFVSGEIVAAFDCWAAVNKFAADKGKTSITTILPDEGSFSFCDAWAIPPTVKNSATVYQWINETLDPAVNAAAAEGLVGGVTVADSVPKLTEGTRALYAYDDLDAYFDKAPFYGNPPVESDEFVTVEEWKKAWDDLKLSAG